MDEDMSEDEDRKLVSDERDDSEALTPVEQVKNRSFGELANRAFDAHESDLNVILGGATGLVAGVIKAVQATPEKIKELYGRIRIRVPDEHYRDPDSWTAGPIFDGIKYLSPGVGLWEKYEALLTKACDSRQDHSRLPKLTRLLGMMTPEDAVVFDALGKLGPTELFNRPVLRTTTWSETDGRASRRQTRGAFGRDQLHEIPPADLAHIIENLEILGLVRWEQRHQVMEDHEYQRDEGRTVQVSREEGLAVTYLGEQFYRACAQPRPASE